MFKKITRTIFLGFILLLLLSLLFPLYYLRKPGFVTNYDFYITLTSESFVKNYYPLWTFSSRSATESLPQLPIVFLLYLLFGKLSASLFFKLMIILIFLISSSSMYALSTYILTFVNKYTNNNIIKNKDSEVIIVLFSIYASLLYTFNPWILNRISHRFLLFTYSFLPLIILINLKILYDKKLLRNIIYFTILSLFSTTSLHSFIFIIFLLVSIYVLSIVLRIYKGNVINVLIRACIVIIIYIVINSYWILPALYISKIGIAKPHYTFKLSDIRLLSRHSQLLNVIRFMGYWWPKASYAPSQVFYKKLWIFASFVPVIIASISLLLYNRLHIIIKKIIIMFFIIFLIIIFLAKGVNPPFGKLYLLLFFNNKIIGKINILFRDPDKWSILLPVNTITLMSLSLYMMYSRIRSFSGIIKRIIILVFIIIIMFLGILYIIIPFNNYFTNVWNPIKIPNEYYIINNYLNNVSKYCHDCKVLWLAPSPPPASKKIGTYIWSKGHYIGVFDVASSPLPTYATYLMVNYPPSDFFYNIIYKEIILKGINLQHLSDILSLFRIKYLIYKTDIIADPNEIAIALENLNKSSLRLVFNTKHLYVYYNPETICTFWIPKIIIFTNNIRDMILFIYKYTNISFKEIALLDITYYNKVNILTKKVIMYIYKINNSKLLKIKIADNKKYKIIIVKDKLYYKSNITLIKIDNNLIKLFKDNFIRNTFSATIYLKQGIHNIRITGCKNCTLIISDAPSILTNREYNNLSINCIFSYIKISNTKYIIKLNKVNTDSFLLVFGDAYDRLWVARYNHRKVSSIPIYLSINGFLISKINKDNSYIIIEYISEKIFKYSIIISIVILFIFYYIVLIYDKLYINNYKNI